MGEVVGLERKQDCRYLKEQTKKEIEAELERLKLRLHQVDTMNEDDLTEETAITQIIKPVRLLSEFRRTGKLDKELAEEILAMYLHSSMFLGYWLAEKLGLDSDRAFSMTCPADKEE